MVGSQSVESWLGSNYLVYKHFYEIEERGTWI
jgi:hypothetical protein